MLALVLARAGSPLPLFFKADRTQESAGVLGHEAFLPVYVFPSDQLRVEGFREQSLIGWRSTLTRAARAGQAHNCQEARPRACLLISTSGTSHHSGPAVGLAIFTVASEVPCPHHLATFI